MKGIRSRADHGLGGCGWEGGGCISCRRGWGEKRALSADHHGPGVTRSLVCAQVLPDAPVTPPVAAHTGLALCRRVECSDSQTVIEGKGSLSNHHVAEPELHTHGDMVGSSRQLWGFTRVWGRAHHTRTGQQGRTLVFPKAARIRLPGPQGWQVRYRQENLPPFLTADVSRTQSCHSQTV